MHRCNNYFHAYRQVGADAFPPCTRTLAGLLCSGHRQSRRATDATLLGYDWIFRWDKKKTLPQFHGLTPSTNLLLP